MDTQTLIYLVVGATFALYIGIAIWTRAGSTSEYYVASKGVHPVLNGMATGATGCRRRPSSPWLASSPSPATTAPST